jgi:hypothetical protein
MRAPTILTSLPLVFVFLAPVHAQEVRTGVEAFGTWQADAPGVSRHIRPADLPPPTHAENDPEAPDFERLPKVVDAPQWAMPDVLSEPASRHPDRPEWRHLRGGKRERTRPSLPGRRDRRWVGDA